MRKPLLPKTLEKKYAELEISKEKIELLHTYFRCFANLYGIISVREAWEVFRNYEGMLVHKKDFVAFSGIVQREVGHPYSVFELNEIYKDDPADPLDRLIVNNKLISSGYYKYYYVYATEHNKMDISYCLPDKQEFLSFTEDQFYVTPYGKKMKTFIERLKTNGTFTDFSDSAYGCIKDIEGNSVKGKCLSEFVLITNTEQISIDYTKSDAKKIKLKEEFSIKASEKVLNRIRQSIMVGINWENYSLGEELNYLIEYLHRELGVDLRLKQIEQLMELYSDLNNFSHLWQKSGWSPKSLARMAPRGLPESITVGPNMRKMFATGEMDEKQFMSDMEKFGIKVLK